MLVRIQLKCEAVLNQCLNTIKKKFTCCTSFLFNVARGVLISWWSMHICHYFQMALSHRCHGSLTICLQQLPVSSAHRPRVDISRLALLTNNKCCVMSHRASWIDGEPQLDSSWNWRTVGDSLAHSGRLPLILRMQVWVTGLCVWFCSSFPSQPRTRWHRLAAKLFTGVSEWA